MNLMDLKMHYLRIGVSCHFIFSGNTNQSHPGAGPASAAGAEEEAGGQNGPGAKSAAGADKEEDIDSC